MGGEKSFAAAGTNDRFGPAVACPVQGTKLRNRTLELFKPAVSIRHLASEARHDCCCRAAGGYPPEILLLLCAR